ITRGAEGMFAHGVTLSPRIKSAVEARVALRSNGEQWVLLATATKAASGPIPIRPGTTWEFGRDSYLPVTQWSERGTELVVQASDNSLAQKFSPSVPESFPLTNSLPLGRITRLTSTSGAAVPLPAPHP